MELDLREKKIGDSIDLGDMSFKDAMKLHHKLYFDENIDTDVEQSGNGRTRLIITDMETGR